MQRQQSKPIQPKFEIDTELANKLYNKEIFSKMPFPNRQLSPKVQWWTQMLSRIELPKKFGLTKKNRTFQQ